MFFLHCLSFLHFLYGIWHANFAEPKMVDWGIPEKIMQNAVQIPLPYVNKTPQL